MKKLLSLVLIVLLLNAICVSAFAEKSHEEIDKIVSDEIEKWEIELQKSEGDWARVYYDEKSNTLYSYADLFLARYGLAGQAYYNDVAIWMIEKFGLFSHINLLSTTLFVSKDYKDTKVVVAYVSGGKKENFEDYYVAEIGNLVSTQDKPSVLYSITKENCNDIGDTNDMVVYDLFFGEKSVVTIKEAAPYLN